MTQRSVAPPTRYATRVPRATAELVDRGYQPGRSTRERMIRTAEQLFAERGIHGVSLREISQASGQRNNGATQYHFGTRENLLAAIYVFRATHINARRWELLRTLEAEHRLDDVHAVLDAILRPHAESIGESDNHFVGYLARILTDEARLSIVDDDDVREQLDALLTLEGHLRVLLPDLSDAQFEARYHAVFNWAIHSLAEHERSFRDARIGSADDVFEELVRMLASALRTPSA